MKDGFGRSAQRNYTALTSSLCKSRIDQRSTPVPTRMYRSRLISACPPAQDACRTQFVAATATDVAAVATSSRASVAYRIISRSDIAAAVVDTTLSRYVQLPVAVTMTMPGLMSARLRLSQF